MGRCLDTRSLVGFVDGDDHHVPGRPWFSSTLGTGRSILNAVIVALQNHDIVVVAYPLRCVNWIYYRRHLAAAGIASVFVGLSASLEEITQRDRGRLLSETEQARLSVMVAEGYSNPLFYDVYRCADQAGRAFAGSHLGRDRTGDSAFLEQPMMNLLALGLDGLAVLATSFLSGVVGMAGSMILMGILLLMMDVTAAMVLYGVTQTAANGWRACSGERMSTGPSSTAIWSAPLPCLP
jgi:hypothetical protein